MKLLQKILNLLLKPGLYKDINYWMNINKLKLNNRKTELLLIQFPHQPLPPLQYWSFV